MERKPFTTTIDIAVQEKFKKKCKENNDKMNDVLEAFMSAYIEDKLKMEVKYTISEK